MEECQRRQCGGSSCVRRPLYGCHKRCATAKQRSDVEMFLKSTPEVTEVRFVSRASAYASFRREFAGQKKVLASVRARDLPESFRVRVSGVADRVRKCSCPLPGCRTCPSPIDCRCGRRPTGTPRSVGWRACRG
ncbi:permease-like cell division protein FtsX [Nonomuraea cavernae]|uniref:permease-like cell division protein FtsX n=1 Tax=Nonomuraea cavernae TaxID=2045107 RepID=UPI0033E8EEAD